MKLGVKVEVKPGVKVEVKAGVKVEGKAWVKAEVKPGVTVDHEIKTNLGLSKSARASDNSNLQGAKYPIWRALQKLYKWCLGPKGNMGPNP